MSFVDSGPARIYYETFSDGERPWIVFAHGAGGNAASWWQQVPYFYDEYNALTFDHRTFGRSACPLEEFDPGEFAGDLAAVLDAEGIERTALVCQSMGGRTGLQFSLQHPDRVTALVMSHTIGAITTDEIVEARRIASESRPAAEAPFGSWAVAPDFHLKDRAKSHLYNRLQAFNLNADRSRLSSAQPSPVTPADLKGFSVPTLFVTADKDVLIPPNIVNMAARLVEGAKVVNLGDAGHSSYFEAPDAFNEVVHGFLREHLA
ncbi:MAG: alpha/beta hydrolase [Gammaproteobacteria bacterium]|jgi:3-oxoadipate enol-lactonase